MFQWIRRRHDRAAVGRAYEAIVEQARRPEFYRDLGVSDSLDGRFDMLVLHMVLVLRRLKGGDATVDAFAQALYNHMFLDMDRSLREIGVSDLSVGKRVRQMGEAFRGRIVAYERGLAGGPAALEEAVVRNVYRGRTPGGDAATRLARYMQAVDAGFLARPVSDLVGGRVRFGADPL